MTPSQILWKSKSDAAVQGFFLMGQQSVLGRIFFLANDSAESKFLPHDAVIHIFECPAAIHNDLLNSASIHLAFSRMSLSRVNIYTNDKSIIYKN